MSHSRLSMKKDSPLPSLCFDKESRESNHLEADYCDAINALDSVIFLGVTTKLTGLQRMCLEREICIIKSKGKKGGPLEKNSC